MFIVCQQNTQYTCLLTNRKNVSHCRSLTKTEGPIASLLVSTSLSLSPSLCIQYSIFRTTLQMAAVLLQPQPGYDITNQSPVDSIHSIIQPATEPLLPLVVILVMITLRRKSPLFLMAITLQRTSPLFLMAMSLQRYGELGVWASDLSRICHFPI